MSWCQLGSEGHPFRKSSLIPVAHQLALVRTTGVNDDLPPITPSVSLVQGMECGEQTSFQHPLTDHMNKY
jgi:hypothetical protein